MLTPLQLTGRLATHVRWVPELTATLHSQAASAAMALRDAARADGLDFTIVSSFRDFDRQVAIWNAKYQGERPLLDRQERPLDPVLLDERARIDAILLWSALPGASRHHWGTDIDVVDNNTTTLDGRPQLTVRAFSDEGPYAALNRWLGENLIRFEFFRPYTVDRGGVQPEPWHLSYAPIATAALEALTPEILLEAIATSSMLGREPVLARLGELYARFVKNVDQALDQAFLI